MEYINLDDSKLVQTTPSLKNLNKQFKTAPAIYIESDVNLEIDGIKFTISGDVYDLSGMTILDLVQLIATYTPNVWLTSAQYTAYPAAMCKDFSNRSLSVNEVDISPYEMILSGTHDPAHLMNTEDITYNVLGVYDVEGAVNYEVVNKTIFAISKNKISAMIEERYTKYFILVQDGKVFNSENILDNTTTTIHNIVIQELNKNDN